MRKVTIEIPDDYEVRVVKKEETVFKDGDILFVECKTTGNSYIFIYKNCNTYRKTDCYCNFRIGSCKIGECTNICEDEDIREIRKASEYERNMIIDALKSNKKSDLLKKFFNIELKNEIKTYQDLIDNNILINGFWINNRCEINPYKVRCQKNFSEEVALSEKVAKSMLAMAMISQLMPYYGGEITDEEWKNSNLPKYVIYSNSKMLSGCSSYINYYYLAFHTPEQRDEFLKNNEQLVKSYLMIE